MGNGLRKELRDLHALFKHDGHVITLYTMHNVYMFPHHPRVSFPRALKFYKVSLKVFRILQIIPHTTTTQSSTTEPHRYDVSTQLPRWQPHACGYSIIQLW
jgi:hypothetical protein